MRAQPKGCTLQCGLVQNHCCLAMSEVVMCLCGMTGVWVNVGVERGLSVWGVVWLSVKVECE